MLHLLLNYIYGDCATRRSCFGRHDLTVFAELLEVNGVKENCQNKCGVGSFKLWHSKTYAVHPK